MDARKGQDRRLNEIGLRAQITHAGQFRIRLMGLLDIMDYIAEQVADWGA